MSSSRSSSQVRVGVRIRPLTSKESSEGGRPIIIGDTLHQTVSISNRRQFTYDSVFPETIAQTELYGDVSPTLLDAFLNGFNATVLAYGQTGSGKTYTMGSEAHEAASDNNNNTSLHHEAAAPTDNILNDNDGLIPRFMSDIFSLLTQRKAATEKILRQRRQSVNNPVVNDTDCPAAAEATGEESAQVDDSEDAEDGDDSSDDEEN